MKNEFRIKIILTLVLIFSITLFGFLPYIFDPNLKSAPIGQPQLANPYVRSTLNDRLLFTYYFYWYDWSTQMHFSSPECVDHCTYHIFDPEHVSYLNASWHYREFKDMMQAGIDVALPVFWGGNPGNGLNDTWSKQGLFVMEQALDLLDLEMNALGNPNPLGATNPIPKMGMFYDTTAMCIEYHYGIIDNDPDCYGDLTNSSHCNTFYLMIHDFFIAFDEDHIQQVPSNDDPSAPTAYIVWLYGNNWFSRVDQSCMDYCKARFLAEFGHSLVFVGTAGWRDGCPRLEGYYHWGTAITGVESINYSPIRITSMGVGFNNGNTTIGAVCQVNQTPIYVPRSQAYYTANLSATLATYPNWVAIETWNEMHEGTSICRTIEYGDTYINLTATFSVQFHAWTSTPINWLEILQKYWGIIPAIVSIGIFCRVMIEFYRINRSKSRKEVNPNA